VGLPEWVPDGVDITTPNAARVYDYTLGGFHNFEVDREFAEAAQKAWPGIFQLAHANRRKIKKWLETLALGGERPRRRTHHRRKTKEPGTWTPTGHLPSAA